MDYVTIIVCRFTPPYTSGFLFSPTATIAVAEGSATEVISMGYRLVTQSLLVTCRPFVKGWIYVRASLWFRLINVNGCPLVWRLNMRYRQGVTMYVLF